MSRTIDGVRSRLMMVGSDFVGRSPFDTTRVVLT
jgi:hypothetical protein